MRYRRCDLHQRRGLRQRTLHRRTMVSRSHELWYRNRSLTSRWNSTGGYGHNANDDNSQCSGYLWSTASDGTPVGDGTCGGEGAYCKDWDQWDISHATPEERAKRWDHNCQSGTSTLCSFDWDRYYLLTRLAPGPTGYCNSKTGACANKCMTAGCDCTSDPDHACGEGLKPVVNSWGKCSCRAIEATRLQARTLPLPPSASAHARARRNLQLFDQFCPSAFTACNIGGTKGYECVDTRVRLRRFSRFVVIFHDADLAASYTHRRTSSNAVLAPARAASTALRFLASHRSRAWRDPARSGPARTASSTTRNRAPAWLPDRSLKYDTPIRSSPLLPSSHFPFHPVSFALHAFFERATVHNHAKCM